MSVLLHSAGFAQPSLPAHTGTSERRLPPAPSGFSKSTGHPLSETRRIQIPVFIMGRPAGHAACFRVPVSGRSWIRKIPAKLPMEVYHNSIIFSCRFNHMAVRDSERLQFAAHFPESRTAFFPGDPFFKETADGQPLSFAFHDFIIGRSWYCSYFRKLLPPCPVLRINRCPA